MKQQFHQVKCGGEMMLGSLLTKCFAYYYVYPRQAGGYLNLKALYILIMLAANTIIQTDQSTLDGVATNL